MQRSGMDWRLLVLVWLLLAAALLARAVFTVGDNPLLADTDDAMRLVVVRDLLAGQGWYDNIQHRMNTPFGAKMHWSRLADLPLAAMMLILRPLLGPQADIVAAFAVPLFLLLPLLWLTGRIAVAIAGREALLAGLVLPALSLSVLAEFNPGRIDHHAMQILLLLTMLWCSIEALTRSSFALGAGLAAAISIAVGIEGLPSVGAAIVVFGLMWVTALARARALRWFGVSFALGTILLLAVTVAPSRWLAPACDAISFTYVAASVAVGVAFAILSLLPISAIWQRLTAGLLTGVAVAAGLALAFPDCLEGPYAALDPWLLANWIDRITEAEPLWTRLLADPVYPIAVVVPCAVALIAAFSHVLRGSRTESGAWLVYAAYLLLAVATMLIQIRASRMATLVAVPGCAAFIASVRLWYLARPAVPRVVGLALSWIASAGIIVAALAAAATAALPAPPGRATAGDRVSLRQCLAPEAFVPLAAMQPARLMAPIDLGSHLLAFTPHEVVGAPYHRNQDGVRDTFAFFNGPLHEARALLDRRGITLVVICPAMPEVHGLADADPNSFAKLYAAGTLPAWLVPESPADAPLQVYRVVP
jgi:hypothetical protein